MYLYMCVPKAEKKINKNSKPHKYNILSRVCKFSTINNVNTHGAAKPKPKAYIHKAYKYHFDSPPRRASKNPAQPNEAWSDQKLVSRRFFTFLALKSFVFSTDNVF